MGNAKNQAEEFIKKYPQNFINFQSHDRKMHLVFAGDPNKRPLLFVHGSPGSWKAWSEFLLNEKLQANFHIIAIDRPGFGGSEKGRVENSLQRQASDIVQALQFNKSGKAAILVGHSLGGPIIARMAMDFPQKVLGLIFVAGSVDPSQEQMKWYQYPAQSSLLRWMIPSDLLVCNDEILTLKNELKKMQPLWSKVTAKSYIIHGEKDDLVPIANVDFLLAHLEKSSVVKVIRVAEMNHFIPWKRQDLIFEAIDYFLRFQ